MILGGMRFVSSYIRSAKRSLNRGGKNFKIKKKTNIDLPTDGNSIRSGAAPQAAMHYGNDGLCSSAVIYKMADTC